MEKIKRERKNFEFPYGKTRDIIPGLLARWDKGEGYIPSEADIMFMRINGIESMNQDLITSTLLATKDRELKVILPYDNSGNHKLTDVARFGLSLINSDEKLFYGGINLNIDERWERLNGRGVYSFKEKDLKLLIESPDLTKEQVIESPLILTKLGCPGYVEKEFERSIYDIEEIIEKTFKLGKKGDYSCPVHDHIFELGTIPTKGYTEMMGQSFLNFLYSGKDCSGKQGLLGMGRLCPIENTSKSLIGELDCEENMFPFLREQE